MMSLEAQHQHTSLTSLQQDNALRSVPNEEPALVSATADASQPKESEGDNGDHVSITDAVSTASNHSVDIRVLTDVNTLAKMDETQDSPSTVEDAASSSRGDRSSQDHQTATATRIEDLEQGLKELRTFVFNLVESGKEDESEEEEEEEESETAQLHKTNYPIHQHELRRVSRSDFQLTLQSVLMPTEQQPALEVLLAGDFDPSSLEQISRVETGDLDTLPSPQTPCDGTTPDLPPKEVHYGTPERLRIRSRPLMSHLQNLTGVPILSKVGTADVKGNKVYSPMSFMRPFKLFVRHEAAIRKSVEKVESRIQEQSAKDSKSSSDSGRENDEESPKPDSFDNTDILQDLKLLVNFLDTDLKQTLDLRRKIRDGTAVDIEYADLWHLFDRGDFLVTQLNKDHAYMVVNVTGGRERLISWTADHQKSDTTSTSVDGFTINCFSVGFDGSSYVPKLETVTIRRFHGTRPISSLSAYPLQLDPNAKELRARHLKSGRSFMEATRESFCHRIVRGKTLDESSHDVDGQVIVDTTLAMKLDPSWRLKTTISVDELTRSNEKEPLDDSWCEKTRTTEGCCGSDIIFKDLELDDMDTDLFFQQKGRMMGPLGSEDFAEEDLMIMRPYVHAFVLRSRRWVTVRTADLHEVVFENNFNDLVLPDNYKTTVEALVRTHERDRKSKSASAGSNSSIGAALDLVKGKGSGLIILLHGPPGVGKTSTAECVSDNTRRPLYPITCGDLGETAAEVESGLQYCFQLAHKWDCVLLLDEADIFLAKRTRHDLRHNAVTSVFLRSLEYYAGILFLTTNRVGALDPAFKSRIQMALFYPALDLEVTCKLYEKFIDRAKAEQDRKKSHQFKIKEKEILRFARRHFKGLQKQHYDTWNGRQIHNAFQTAIALAEHEAMTKAEGDPKPVLGKTQFETVAEGSKKFDEYLVQTLGWTDTDAAKREGLRDDTFMSVPVSAHLAAPLTPQSHRSLPRPTREISRSQVQTPTRGARDSCSDEDSDSDSDTDSGDEEDEDEERERSRARKGAAEKEAGGQTGAVDMEFQQFMSWKKMQKAR